MDVTSAGDIIKKMFGDYGKEIGKKVAVCVKHGEYESVGTIGMDQNPWYSGCPACLLENDERRKKEYEAREEKERIEREAEDERRRISNLRSMGIEPAYYEATLDTFIAETPEQQHNVKRVREIIHGDIKKIIMLGLNGTGKTHLACAAVQALEGKIITMYEISAMIRASYNGGETELAIVERLSEYSLLVIDEMGRTKGSEAESNWLSFVIDKRHVRGLPLILISNKHERKRCAKNGCQDCIENYIAEDVMSRIRENGVLLHFTGEDWRKRTAENRDHLSKRRAEADAAARDLFGGNA